MLGRPLVLGWPGGIGKSKLAIAVGRSLLNDYPEGVWFVSLAGVEAGDEEGMILQCGDHETVLQSYSQFYEGVWRPLVRWTRAEEFFYDTFDPAQERLREALCTLGNGYFATRGAAPESPAGPIHFVVPGVSESFGTMPGSLSVLPSLNVNCWIISRIASMRFPSKNMCSVRHRPIPSAPNPRAIFACSGISAFART